MAARRKQAGTRKSGSRKRPARAKKAAPAKKRAGRRSPKRAARGKRAPSWSASIAERLAELVEHVAAGAVRGVLDIGGREIGEWLPEASQVRVEAGAYLRELRELAGLTIDELAAAIELKDRSILEAVEAGTTTLSFELILRLAAILARHDPAPFVTQLVRSYNPVLWQLLEDWGVGRLPLQGAREREFVNVLRASDEARALSDEDFQRVMDFTRNAFATAMHFALASKAR